MDLVKNHDTKIAPIELIDGALKRQKSLRRGYNYVVTVIQGWCGSTSLVPNNGVTGHPFLNGVGLLFHQIARGDEKEGGAMAVRGQSVEEAAFY